MPHRVLLQKISELSLQLLSEKTVQGVLDRVHDVTVQVIPAHGCSASYRISDSAYCLSSSSLTHGRYSGGPLAFSQRGVYTLLDTGQVNAIRLARDELFAHPLWQGLPENHPSLAGLLGARTVDDSGCTTGMILVTGRKEGDFTADDEEALLQVAGVASLALQHVHARIDAEEKARQISFREERYQAILDAMPSAVFAKDRIGRYVFLNTAAARWTGEERTSLLGRTDVEIFPADVAASFMKSDVKAREGMAVDFEDRFLRPDGMHVYLVQKFPLHADDGSVELVCGISTDVTDEVTAVGKARQSAREAEESEQKYRSLYLSMAEGFALHELVYDSGGIPVDYRILDVNPAFSATTGIPAEAAVGAHASILYGMGQPPCLDIYARVAATGVPEKFEKIFEPEGRRFRISAFSPKRDQFATVFEDITEKQRVEAALRSERATVDAMMQATDVMLVFLDADFNFVAVNRAYAAACGYSPEEMVGKNHFVLYPHEENEKIFREVRDTGVPVFFKDKPFVYADQPERGVTYWDWSLVPVKDSHGMLNGLVFSLRETTEFKRTQEALRAAEEQYRTLFNRMSEGFAVGEIIHDGAGKPADFRFVEMNAGFTRQCGVGREILGRPAREVLPLVDPSWLEQFSTVARTGKPLRFETYSRDLDRYFDIFCYSPSEEKFALHFHNITDRRIAEEELRKAHEELERRVEDRTAELQEAVEALEEEQERYELSIDALQAAMWEWRPQDGLYFSSEVVSMLGFTEETMPTTIEGWSARIHSDDRRAWRGKFAAFLKGDIDRYDVDFRVLHTKGEYRWLNTQAVAVRRVDRRAVRVVGATRDITPKKVAEQRVLRMNRLYGALTATNKAILRATGRLQLFSEICDIAVKEAGFTMAWIGAADDATGEVIPIVSAGDETGYLQRIKISALDEPLGRGPTGKALREGGFHVCTDFDNDETVRIWRGEAADAGFRSAASFAISVGGRVEAAFALYATESDFFNDQQLQLLQQMTADVSFAIENLERDRLLRLSEEKFRSLFEASKDAIFFATVEGDITDINNAGEDLLGWSREELVGKPLQVLCVTAGDYHDLVGTLESDGFVRDAEITLRRKTGEHLLTLMTVSSAWDERGRISGYRGIIHDVTARRKLEQQVVQSQKMESVGLLAGGVAHDFNNILMVISGFSEEIAEEADGDLAFAAEQVVVATRRARELTSKLLTFSRKKVMSLSPLDINQLVTDMVKFLSRLLTEKVSLVPFLSLEPQFVMADAGQLEQVLTNLVVNARDAMPRGGTITIVTEAVTVRPEDTSLQLRPRDYVVVRVCDTGHGIAEGMLERIFEPFFTTKGIEKGSGLGLSIAYGIVQQHGGTIAVASSPGNTVFEVYIPAAEAPLPAQEARAATPEKGMERILVVEDDDSVRTYISMVLRRAGYDVSVAADGAEAVPLFEAKPARLVVSDVLMPHMNGKELHDELRRRGYDVPFVFLSGHTADIITSEGIAIEHGTFVQKPIGRNDLLQTVREVLDGA